MAQVASFARTSRQLEARISDGAAGARSDKIFVNSEQCVSNAANKCSSDCFYWGRGHKKSWSKSIDMQKEPVTISSELKIKSSALRLQENYTCQF